MRPNISNCHALPGSLIIFEGPDGSGKSTQIKLLKKLLEREGKKVTVSSWKNCPILGDFLKENEGLKKFDERVLPETNLFLQAADLLYRIEREVIPAMKKGHIVILDRGPQTLIVRGLMLGMSNHQLRDGLLWWRNTVYKELLDKSLTIELTINLDESLIRLKKRALKEDRSLTKAEKKAEGTLLGLDFINSLVYSPEGKKMTRNDKRQFIRKTQNDIIENYKKVFKEETGKGVQLTGEGSLKEVEYALKRKVIDSIF
ncbi:MAG: dTMP kinase [Candidatus Altimarinota bacterium]